MADAGLRLDLHRSRFFLRVRWPGRRHSLSFTDVLREDNSLANAFNVATTVRKQTMTENPSHRRIENSEAGFTGCEMLRDEIFP